MHVKVAKMQPNVSNVAEIIFKPNKIQTGWIHVIVAGF